MKTLKLSGFTLIELLIVVAIIAILAAIAVPNFLEAQTRAKVSRARADMRSMTTAMETYRIDNNTYVFQNPQYRALRINDGQPLVLENLTTPVAYLTSIMSFTDIFKADKIYIGASLPSPPAAGPDPSNVANYRAFQLYKYYARNSTTAAIGGRDGDEKPHWYIIGSAGPDGAIENLNDPLSQGPASEALATAFYANTTAYNATNGTISRGSLYRVGGSPTGKGKAFYFVSQNNQ